MFIGKSEKRWFKMVKYRELVNTAILNDEEWLGFFGDSEYETDDGEIRMGYWSFIGVFRNIPQRFYKELDDDISDDALTGEYIYRVMNDNGNVCEIILTYND